MAKSSCDTAWSFCCLNGGKKINLINHIVLQFFKFKTSDNLVGLEPMPDNVSPKQQILVASMDIQQNANDYMQKINTITQPFLEILVISRKGWVLVISRDQRTLGMPHHTTLKQDDHAEASLDA